jgi:hypothetical protein
MLKRVWMIWAKALPGQYSADLISLGMGFRRGTYFTNKKAVAQIATAS